MRVLIVDDNEISLEIQKQLLIGCGFSVFAVDSGEKAVEVVRENAFDFVFTDIQMPGMNGFETAEKIREFNKDIKIFALSAEDIESTNADFVKAEMNGAIKKPLTEENVNNAVNGNDIVNCPDEKNDIFGYEELLSLVGDDESVLMIVESFLETHKDDLKELNDYIPKKDFLAARGVMHNLTGVSGSLFCHRLFEASNNLSADLRAEKSDSFPQFTQVWNLTVKELSDYVQKLSR